MFQQPQANLIAQWADAVKAQRDATAQAEAAAAQRAEAERQRVEALKQTYGEFAQAVDKAAKRNELFTRSVRDGTYDRHVRQMRQLNDQYERLRQRADAIARFGPRLGAIMSNRGVQMAGRVGVWAGGAALATGAGLARSGLSGTVEGNRLGLETTLLAREVAGAMKPFSDGITNATVKLRKWMEGLSDTGQDMVMYGGLLATGLVALRTVLGGQAFGSLASGAMSAVTSPMAFLSANRRGLAGAAGLGLLTYGAATDHRGMGALGGAITGYSVGGPWGAVAGAAAGTVASSSDYSRLRGEGRSRGMSALYSLAAVVGDLGDYVAGSDSVDRWRKKADATAAAMKASGDPHRAVTLADAGFEGVGSGYDRLSTALALVDASTAAAREEAAAAADPSSELLRTAMERLTEAVREAAGGGMPRPASGTGGTS